MNAIAENKKFITTAELKDMGYSYYKIGKLEEQGILSRVNRSTYENLTYVRFVNEDKEAMLSGMQRTQDEWDSQKSRAMAKQEEYEQEQRELRRTENEKWNADSGVKLGGFMKQARDLLKLQYDNYKENIDGLLNAAFENIK